MHKFLAACALGATIGLAGCGSDNGNNQGLSAQEQAALLQALASAEVTDAGLTSVALQPFFSQATIGTLGDYAAAGAELKATVEDGTNSITFVGTSVLGWQGLNTGAKTVDKAISASSFSEGVATFPATIDDDIATGNASATYFDGTSTYFGDQGVFRMTSATFGSTSNCPNIPPSSGGFTITECRYATGSMRGNFDFTAKDASDNTYTQPNISYDVPAVQLSITIHSDTPISSLSVR